MQNAKCMRLPICQQVYLQYNSVPRTPGTLQQRRQKTFKCQRVRDSIFQKLRGRYYTQGTSSIWLSKQDPNKENTNRHANIEQGNITEAPLDKQLKAMTSERENISLSQGGTKYKQATPNGLSKLFYMFMHMSTIIKENEAINFKECYGHRCDWREERKRENYIIILWLKFRKQKNKQYSLEIKYIISNNR